MTDFAKTRQMFDIPPGVIYLNGNSLGPMPKAAPNAINSFLMDAISDEPFTSTQFIEASPRGTSAIQPKKQ